MDINASLEKLFSLHNFGIKLGLDNIKAFLAHIGNPEAKLKAIHIAGSNGKGSTASFIYSILREADFRVGLYTSPHFVKFNERILVDGNYISDKYIADFISKHQKYIDVNGLTFFEVTTALAFEYFKIAKVDYAIIETGLGGRLDATNVLNPLACVITAIHLEHTNILGDKISQIAYEKAEIIKPGAKIFVGKLHPDADEVVEKKCKDVNAKLFRLEEYINEKDDQVELYTEELELEEWEIPLPGKYQKYNAALAALVVAKTFSLDSPSIIEDGLKNVIKNSRIQGRYEFVKKNPFILLDSAHNPDGIKLFLEEFSKEKDKYSEVKILFSALKDKNLEEMFGVIKNYFSEVDLTVIDYERAADIDLLIDKAKNVGLSHNRVDNKRTYVKNHLYGERKNCLIVVGSMYLVGEIKKLLAEL